jgi:hypothetical protein
MRKGCYFLIRFATGLKAIINYLSLTEVATVLNIISK